MTHVTPNSFGTPLEEFNTCHTPSGAKGGQFCSTKGGGSRRGGSVDGGTGATGVRKTRPTPIQVDSVKEAVRLILKGKTVELKDARQVNTVLTKLAAIAKEAKRLGKDAPNYDLCQVSVPGTNLFCSEKVRTEEHPEGVPRIAMPQLGGIPRPGSRADKLARRDKDSDEVDASDAFIQHLLVKGIDVTRTSIPAAKLKASQAELIGAKVAKMMVGNKDPARNPIFISRDNYVLDGHHRWAAVVGRDASDNRLGDLKMKVIRVDAPISELLHEANRWTRSFGITPAAGNKKKRG